ncbi:MAG: CHAT domain-containing protein, partial [Candidatus Aminicenantes bacterium]|nr:CHAT domain-containing protein [Candidatus Aminicenantes bacterium]
AVLARLELEQEYCLYNLGLYHQSTGNFPAALDHFSRAYDLAVRLGDASEQSSCLLSLGAVHLEIGNFDRAAEKLEAALAIDEKLGDAGRVAQALNNLGIIHRKKGYASGDRADYERALVFYREALGHAERSGNKKDELKVLNNIGSLLTDLDRDLEALDYFKRALAEAERYAVNDLVVICLTNLGIVSSKLGNHEASIRYYRRSIDMGLRYNRVFLWDAYLEIANSYKKQGMREEALRNYRTAVAVIEDLRSKIDLEEYRAAYLGSDKRLEAYRNLMDLLVDMHRDRPGEGFDRQAFHCLERAKARAFLDSLEISHIDIKVEAPAPLLNREEEILSAISRLHSELLETGLSPERKASLEAELAGLEEAHEDLKRRMRRESPAYAALRYPEIIDVEDARKLLPDGRTAIIAYGVGRDRSYGFSLSRKKLVIFPLPGARALKDKISAYLGEITDRSRPASTLGREIETMLVAPGRQPGIRNILFVADDILNYLPFEVLPLSDAPGDRLIARYGVSYAPSVTSLRELGQRSRARNPRRRGGGILLIGDPALDGHSGRPAGPDDLAPPGAGLPRLKFSGREIENIAALYKRPGAAVFSGGEAAESLIKSHDLERYRVIHFSAHGLVDDRNPARSAVVLARNAEDGEDGFLRMREIYNLRLNAGLVVLSACDTGIGPHIHGEGLQGLNRAFFFAGAEAVLMSLWAVQDEASAQLMTRFHTHLRRGERIAGALRLAKMEMARSAALSHPYYWAGFVVTGRADRVLYPRPRIPLLPAAGAALLLLVPVIFRVLKKKKRPRSAV